MRRTHIMHPRDNRRPHYYAQRDHRDTRPALEWRGGSMLLDGVEVAKVICMASETMPEPWDRVWQQPREPRHDAVIVHGPRAGERRACDDSDAARLFCESVFAQAPAQRAA